MSKKVKKYIKTTGIIVGVCAGVALLGTSWVGLGLIFQEQYHDPEFFRTTMYQHARYGWSRKLNDGWAA